MRPILSIIPEVQEPMFHVSNKSYKLGFAQSEGSYNWNNFIHLPYMLSDPYLRCLQNNWYI